MPYSTLKAHDNDSQNKPPPRNRGNIESSNYSLPSYSHPPPPQQAFVGIPSQYFPAQSNISTQHSNASPYSHDENVYQHPLTQMPQSDHQNVDDNYRKNHFSPSESRNRNVYEDFAPPLKDNYHQQHPPPPSQQAYRHEKYFQPSQLPTVPNNYQNSDKIYHSKQPIIQQASQSSKNHYQPHLSATSNPSFDPKNHPNFLPPENTRSNMYSRELIKYAETTNEKEVVSPHLDEYHKDGYYHNHGTSTSYRNQSQTFFLPTRTFDIPPKPPVRTSSLKESIKENEADSDYHKDFQANFISTGKSSHQRHSQKPANYNNYGHRFHEKTAIPNYFSESTDSGLSDKESVQDHFNSDRRNNIRLFDKSVPRYLLLYF